jgi:hypothetical protein
MDDKELMSLPDVTPSIGYTEREVDGKKVRIPQMGSAGFALYQKDEDGVFVGPDGQRWITGWLHGQRVRQRA